MRNERNKFNAIFLAILVIAMVFSQFCFNGCNVEESGSNVWFTTVYTSRYYNIVYDNDTKVMYCRYSGGMTMMVNADGSPRLYKVGVK